MNTVCTALVQNMSTPEKWGGGQNMASLHFKKWGEMSPCAPTDLCPWPIQLHCTCVAVKYVKFVFTLQTSDDKELSSEMLTHVARSLTLWEFLMLKLGRGRGNTEQAKIAEILTEFSELHSKVKAVSHEVLTPAMTASDAEVNDAAKHIMVNYLTLMFTD